MDRFVALKKRLEAMRFYEPLGMESVPLVERILGELLLASETVTSLEGEVNKLRAENKTLISEKDKNRVLNECNALHQRMVTQTVQAHARERQCELSLQKMSDQVKDTRFLNTQLCTRLTEREKELQELSKKHDELMAQQLIAVRTSSGKNITLRDIQNDQQKKQKSVFGGQSGYTASRQSSKGSRQSFQPKRSHSPQFDSKYNEDDDYGNKKRRKSYQKQSRNTQSQNSQSRSRDQSRSGSIDSRSRSRSKSGDSRNSETSSVEIREERRKGRRNNGKKVTQK